MKRERMAWVVGSMLLLGAGVAAADTLVYDNNTNNHYAQAAAAGLPGPVTVADSATFDALLVGQPWDIVLVDCPSTRPAAGWGALINYVNGGGRVVMSFWDWDNDSSNGDPGLFTAFGFDTATSFGLVDGVDVLSAAPTPAGGLVFAGVPGMPHSEWFDAWGDDGDYFTFSGGYAIAQLNGDPDPVTIVNDGCNAIATFAVDEWEGAGAVEYWQGMANLLLDGCRPPEQLIAEIPTLSPAGLGALALLLAAAALYLRRRRIA